MICKPVQMKGGFLHRMYEIRTDIGKFAIKALNPNIMIRADAITNYALSEMAANRSATKIKVSCANEYNGSYLQKHDNQYYLVYDYVNGSIIGTDKITPEHSYRMGKILAEIHSCDFSDIPFKTESADIESHDFDWTYYLQEGEKTSEIWCHLLRNNISLLDKLTNKMNSALKRWDNCLVVSHCDLDFKNVMWQEGEPIVIDWECAGYIDSSRDLIGTALYWSLLEDDVFSPEHFAAFINGYSEVSTINECNVYDALYCGLEVKFDWLEYNLKRSLGIECADENEKRLGSEQVVYSIGHINRYRSNFEAINKCFAKCL